MVFWVRSRNMSATVAWGSPAFHSVLERACSQENRDCVAHRQQFDDFVRALPGIVQTCGGLDVTVEHLPGLQWGQSYGLTVRFQAARMGKPVFIHKNGDVVNGLTPARARVENLTYAAPLHVNLRVETREPSPTGVMFKGTTASDVFLGLVPVMVGSHLCTTRHHPAAAAQEIDKGGYFIVKGNEKVIPYFRKTDVHSLVCYVQGEGETCTTVRSGSAMGRIRSTRLVKAPDAPARVKFRQSHRVAGGTSDGAATPGAVLRALGVVDPVGEVFDHLHPADAAFYGAASFAGGDDGDDDDDDDDGDASGAKTEAPLAGLFPGTAPALKAQALVSMLRLGRHMREARQFTERDSLQTQQLEGVRELFQEVFEKHWRSTMRMLRQRVETKLGKLHRQRHDGRQHRAATLRMPDAAWVKTQLAKHNTIGPGMTYFCATGNVQGGAGAGRGGGGAPRTGLVQLLQRTSELEFLASFNKVVTGLDAQQAPTQAREYQLDFLGRLCVVATPEGKRTGLINQKVVGASCSRDRFAAVPALCDMARHCTTETPAHWGARAAGVWVSGTFVGCTLQPRELAAALRAARRSGQVPRDVGVSVYGDVAVEIRVHAGRLLRPLLPLHAGTPPLRRDTTWSHLLHAGVVETLDAREEGGAYVRAFGGAADPRHTHAEVFPTASLGCAAATIPFLDHEPSPRASYFTSQANQAMGFDPRTFTKHRLDTKAFGLWYPQRSLVNTSYSRASGAESRQPTGQSVVVAVMSCQGAEEDAILVNKAAVQRGLFRGTEYATKTVTTADRCAKVFAADAAHPTLDPHTGLAKVGAVLRQRDAYACLASPHGVQVLKHGGALPARVERVVAFTDPQGYATAKLKLRTDRPLMVGDKLSSRFAQKGVVSRLVPPDELPFDEATGVVPDLVVHPCFLPSRMTVGQLMEGLAGFAACQLGMPHVDATAFAHSTASLVEGLRRRGFQSSAVRMRDPFTGERYPDPVELHVVQYNRLNKFSSQKMRLRDTGRRNAVTGQPVAGKHFGEKALRCGVMEMAAMAAHGGSATLSDACRARSDGLVVRVCAACGNSHVRAKGAPCPACGGAEIVDVETTCASVRMTQVCEAMGMGMRLVPAEA